MNVLIGPQPGSPLGSCPLPRATCPLNDPCQFVESTVPTLGQGEPLRAAQENGVKAASPALGTECWCYSVRDLRDMERNMIHETPKSVISKAINRAHVPYFL